MEFQGDAEGSAGCDPAGGSRALSGCLPAEAFEHFRIREQQLLRLNEELEKGREKGLSAAEKHVRVLQSSATQPPPGSHTFRPKSAITYQGDRSRDEDNWNDTSTIRRANRTGCVAGQRSQSASACRCDYPPDSARNKEEKHFEAPASPYETDRGGASTQKVRLRESVLKDPYTSGQRGSHVQAEYMRFVQQGCSAIGSGAACNNLEALTATTQLQKSRILALQQELDLRAKEVQKYEQDLHASRNQANGFADENEKLKRIINQLNTQEEKTRQAHAELASRVGILEDALANLRAENDRLTECDRKTAAELITKGARIIRLTEELETVRTQLKDCKSNTKDSLSAERQIEKLIAANKKLENQRNELVVGFKKQMKLINILKKQKAHMEAARLLSFTEDEFLKVIRADERNAFN
ncbi:hypothetical protein BESB_065890 [Besnoitia besnoiti]|uniref:Uncharacterized protein n=1 Tax=Besnoitia besnoiti TaxID=94643 RepID=A0A2A9MF35_BESBE|nr:hypothetical protein BESB_065890 [Besnoitia besnoiti]PFH34556.1 hypothetical protein BESB_065890 [Besnoitia besnoiti]